MLTVILGTYVVGELLLHPEGSHGPSRRTMDVAAGVYAQAAAEAYERDGQSGLLAYAVRVEHDANARLFLFNGELKELTGRSMPDAARVAAQKALETRLPEFVAGPHPPMVARPVIAPSGAEYVLVSEVFPRPPPPALFHPMFHVLGVALVGAVFCYWLARYLTSPVTKLRAATKELAAGNLGTRVVPRLGTRRDELTALGADFDLMAEQIEALITSQRRLLGDISHELRSPLARLNVALELARQRAGADATTALERIQREAENLNEMIGQLLALTRLESGAAELRPTEFDLAELLSDIAEDANFESHSRNRSVKLEAPERCKMSGTEHLLRRAIENVVRNALQHTSEGSQIEVKLDCAAKPESGEQSAAITVRDHGGGVPEEALGELFRPFYRVDEARDRGAGGVGLGLAITERAVRLHGGSVTAENSSTGGLIVTITLPVKQNN